MLILQPLIGAVELARSVDSMMARLNHYVHPATVSEGSSVYKKLVLLLALFTVNCGCTGKTSEELFAEGSKALLGGDSGSAIVLLRGSLEKNQNNCEARYQLARAYEAVGKYELAEKEYQKVKRLNPAQTAIQLDLSRLYNLMKKPDLAIAYAEEHLSADPDSTDALEALGTAYVLQEKLLDAETFFLRALQKSPEKQSARLELAALYLKQGKPEQAKAVVKEVLIKNQFHVRANYLVADAEIALGRKNEARAIYQKLIAHNADNSIALFKAGILDLELGNTASAEKIAELLVSKFPKQSEGYRLKGFVLFQRKDFSAAITAFQTANKLQPSVAGHYFLGLSLFGAGNLESALSQFRTILDRLPNFHQARLITGAILLQQRRLDDAISEVSKLIDADDRNALAHNLLGSAYMAKGMYEEGIRAFDRSIKLDPKLIDTYLKKGMIHLSQGNLKDVEADLATAVRIEPGIANPRIILSAFHVYRNNRAKAMTILSEGLTGSKSDAVLYAAMARIMASENRAAEAIRYLQKSKEKDPGAVDPYFMLADFYVAQRDTAKALAEYSSLLQQHPANTRAFIRMAGLMESENRQNEALILYQKAKETHEVAGYLALAHYHEQRGSLKDAQSVYSEARIRFPRSVPVLEQQGRFYLKNSNTTEALKTFSDIEAVSPESGITLLVATHASMNNLPEAVKAARRAIMLKPDAPFGYQLLASLYTGQNNLESAIEELKKAVERNRNNPQPALALAGLYTKAGKHGQALLICSDVVRKYPNYAPAYFTLGTVLDAKGEQAEAVKKYRSALALSGSYLPALNNLAFLCAEGYCSKEEALRLAQSANTFSPDKPEVLDTLGYALLKNGRPREALMYLQKSEARLAGNPQVNYHLALAHKELGEQKQAVERLQVALRSDSFKETQQAKALLAELD